MWKGTDQVIGIKKNFKGLEYPWSKVKTIIRKWKVYGTTKTLPRSGRPSKLGDQVRRRLIREATTRPLTALKELHASMAKTGNCVHMTTISQALHKSGLHSWVARSKSLLKKAHLQSRLKHAKNYSGDSEAM